MRSASLAISVVGLLVWIGVSGAAYGFLEVPPTWGLARPTIGTLRSGELQLGLTSVTDPTSLYLFYGFTSDLMGGLWPIKVFQGMFNVYGKFRFSLGPELDMALWGGYLYWPDTDSYELQVGVVHELWISPSIWLDTGLIVVTGRHCRWVCLWWGPCWWECWQVLVSTPYVLAQFALTQTARVMVEVEAVPLKVRAGVLVRVLDRFDLRAVINLLPSNAFWLGAEVRLILKGPGERPKVR